MKLYELFLGKHDPQMPNPNQRKKFSDNEMMQAYDNVVDRGPMSMAEIKELSQMMGDSADYDRTKGSAMFLLARMQMSVWGEVPDGATEKQAELWFIPSENINQFVVRQGDVSEQELNRNLEKAKVNYRPPPPKAAPITKEEASGAFVQAYTVGMKENGWPQPKSISSFYLIRKEATEKIMKGMEPSQAIAETIAKYSK